MKPGRPRVLLVDDEEHILSALGRVLRREGYEILSAGTGAEALQLLEAEPVDLILSDHKMPGMSGLALLERAAGCRPRAVRMLLTGWPGEIPPRDLERIGVAALIEKPWNDGELKAALRRALATGA